MRGLLFYAARRARQERNTAPAWLRWVSYQKSASQFHQSDRILCRCGCRSRVTTS